MQRSIASMVGVPVITAQGVRMGEIRDAWVEPSEHRVLAFIVDWEESQSIHQDDVLPLVDIIGLNADVATVDDELGAGHGLELDFPVGGEGFLRAIEQIIDLRLIDDQDQLLGLVTDVHFDPTDGGVHAYEIGPADGANEDAKLLTPHHGLEFRDGDALVCPQGCLGHFNDKATPRVDILMMRELGLEELQGEEDVEVARSHGQGET